MVGGGVVIAQNWRSRWARRATPAGWPSAVAGEQELHLHVELLDILHLTAGLTDD